MRHIALAGVAIGLAVALRSGDARGLAPHANDSGGSAALGSVAAANPDSILDPPIDWPLYYGVQQTGTINTTFDCFGQIGVAYSDWSVEVPEWPTAAFESPPGTGIEYSFSGSVWIGGIVGGDTLVSTGTGAWYRRPEMYPPGYLGGSVRGTVTRIYGPADFSMRAEFTDTIHENVKYWPDVVDGRAHLPLNLRIVNRSHVWRSAPASNTILYDLMVTNIGEETILAGCLGLYFDCDIGDGTYWNTAYDDLVGSIRSHGIGYAIDNDGNPVGYQLPDTASPRRAFGVKFLKTSFQPNDTTFNWWTSPLSQYSDWAPRMRGTDEYPFRDFGDEYFGTPEGDCNAYYVMRKPEWDYDQILTRLIGSEDSIWLPPDASTAYDITIGADIRFLMSIGPFDLAPDSSIRVLFATFAPDSVIYRSDMMDIIEILPQFYSQCLDLVKLIETGAVSDSLAELLVDPSSPVTGLHVEHNDPDSLVVGWDPWVFSTITGYDVFLDEIPLEALPYPGVVPPWYRPPEATPVASVGLTEHYAHDCSGSSRLYCIHVAHRTHSGIGDIGQPLLVDLGGRAEGPAFDCEYTFAAEGLPVHLDWYEPEDIAVAYYAVYKFCDSAEARHRYHAFYDAGVKKASIAPVDSFEVDGQEYFYYAMQPHVRVSGRTTEYVDYYADDQAVYVVTAVDSCGFESEFSIPVTFEQVEPQNKDILVLTYSNRADNFVEYDTIRAYYDSVLKGYGYDMFHYRDTFSTQNCPDQDANCMDWHQFTRYRLVIVDDGMRDEALSTRWESATSGMTRYLLSGGKLAYFGSLSTFNSVNINAPAATCPITHSFVRRFFDIDSIFYVGAGYFLLYSVPPYTDSLFGFSFAEPTAGSIPTIRFDTLRYPFTSEMSVFWPIGTPPSVSTFAAGDSSQVTHRFRSTCPTTSILESLPVGVRTERRGVETWLFGFHLWYMDYDDARTLIDWFGISPDESTCCVGYTGNVDGSPDEQADIADLLLLVRHLFVSFEPLACHEEGNIDGDPHGLVDIADVTALIYHLFRASSPTAPCR